jgi:putative sigma-54 modulation protein
MRYTVSGKNMNVSQALKDNAIHKLSKLEKYFTKENDVRITMKLEKLNHIIEVTIPMKGMVIRAEEEADNMYAAIDQVVDVLERQILKHKDKLIQRHRAHGNLQVDFLDTYEEDTQPLKIIKSDRFADKPMDA